MAVLRPSALCSLPPKGAQRALRAAGRALIHGPRYLTPVGGASAGFVSMQKTAVALYGEIRRHANPAGLDQFAVSETVEDHSSQAPLVYAKLADQVAALERLVALEMLVAAQAVDLRKPKRLGEGTAPLHATIRAVVPALKDDRENGPDVETIVAMLRAMALE